MKWNVYGLICSLPCAERAPKGSCLHFYVQFHSDFPLNLICLQHLINNCAEQLMSSSSVIWAEPLVTSTTSIFLFYCPFIAWPLHFYCLFFISWIHLVKIKCYTNWPVQLLEPLVPHLYMYCLSKNRPIKPFFSNLTCENPKFPKIKTIILMHMTQRHSST